MKSAIGQWCAALALLVVSDTVADARDDRQVISLKVCIDGLTNLHVKGGRLSWEHLAFDPPAMHPGCKGISAVDGVPWRDWSKSFPLPAAGRSATIAFHPVRCRGNCVLVQSPSAENGWEAIYQFDDFWTASSSVYCVNIVIGGPPESAADQSVQHIEPAPYRRGGRPLFRAPGGKLREETCAPDVFSWLGSGP